jgi:hypothetical protein
MVKKMKYQIPSIKFQISTNDQNQNPLTLPLSPQGRGRGEGWLLEIGDLDLFGIWSLEFEMNSRIRSQLC